ncbi:hypothetical protein KO561_05620 [Radiobacillus kanasensis]|uniref:hypothetical protein n=1 Tax=Radiobacillus kanasensis TaxID=2844358 RepID=UPI001E6129E5|nr:hypothetical protein [Radiobacillus kanasensis]UFU00425.1 hypothetical protein KO561_05620 [Radiobacillus kanasensis]
MKSLEVLLWSIAFPGFGQLLNKSYIKGLLFIFLEFLININSNFNEIIYLSFIGETSQALEVADFSWLMFYPCIYFFSMWDAFQDAGGGKQKYSYLPFAFCAYFVTIGIIFSPKVTIYHFFPGPVLLPMSGVIPGLIIGFLLKKWLIRRG